MPLPTIALAIPPPGSPAGSGSLVKKFQSSDRQPFHNRNPKIRNSTDTVNTVQRPVSASITLLTAFLRPVLVIRSWTLS